MDSPNDQQNNAPFSLRNNTLNYLNSTPTQNSQNLIGPFDEKPSNHDPLYLVIPVSVIYLLIFLSGIIGNVSTCIVVIRNKSMHTATNYYLFSLAVSDLLLLISGLPVEVYLVWSKYPYIFGEGFCVLRGLAAEWSTNASILTITAFSVERYVAICHPFLSHTMSKLSRAIKLILIIWLIALVFAIPQAMQFGIVQMSRYDPELIMCTLKIILVQHSFELSTLFFFIVPMTLIIILYILIGIKLKKSNMMKKNKMRSQRGGKAKHCRRETAKSSGRVVKMLVAVVVAFFICWAPFHVQRLIAIYGTSTDHISSKSKWFEILYYIFTYVSGVLYYLSTTINPILYNIMSHKFRAAFMETLATTCSGNTSSEQRDQRPYSSLSRTQRRTPGVSCPRSDGSASRGEPHNSDYSGNSVRVDSSRQLELTAAIQTNGVCRILPAASCQTSSTNDGSSIQLCGSQKDEISMSQCDSPQIRGWPRNACRPLRLIDKRDRLKSATSYVKTTIPSDRLNAGRRWWRFFKWIPGPKAFQFNTSVNGTNGIVDIENNREKFPMTTCYVARPNRFV